MECIGNKRQGPIIFFLGEFYSRDQLNSGTGYQTNLTNLACVHAGNSKLQKMEKKRTSKRGVEFVVVMSNETTTATTSGTTNPSQTNLVLWAVILAPILACLLFAAVIGEFLQVLLLPMIVEMNCVRDFQEFYVVDDFFFFVFFLFLVACFVCCLEFHHERSHESSLKLLFVPVAFCVLRNKVPRTGKADAYDMRESTRPLASQTDMPWKKKQLK